MANFRRRTKESGPRSPSARLASCGGPPNVSAAPVAPAVVLVHPVRRLPAPSAWARRRRPFRNRARAAPRGRSSRGTSSGPTSERSLRVRAQDVLHGDHPPPACRHLGAEPRSSEVSFPPWEEALRDRPASRGCSAIGLRDVRVPGPSPRVTSEGGLGSRLPRRSTSLAGPECSPTGPSPGLSPLREQRPHEGNILARFGNVAVDPTPSRRGARRAIRRRPDALLLDRCRRRAGTMQGRPRRLTCAPLVRPGRPLQ